MDKFDRAVSTYMKLCDVLDEQGWHYQKHDERLTVTLTVTGDDIPMFFIIRVAESSESLTIISPMEICFPEDKRTEGAIAVAAASFGSVGSFDYDLTNGRVAFRMSERFTDREISAELIKNLIHFSVEVTDQYNDMFLALAKGYMDITAFIEKA